MVTGNPGLSKSSGWRSLAPDSISKEHFKLVQGFSAAINAGTPVQ
jgi:hypothetical protein